MSSDAFKTAKDRARNGAQPPPLPAQRNEERWGPPTKLGQVAPPPVPSGVDLLKIEDISQYKNLLVFAKAVIEGYFSGKHKSADYGSNAEFAEHKFYNPGDPIEHIDWRVYARTHDVFVRRYREETDMAIYLVVDMSGSMAYQGMGQEPQISARRPNRCLTGLSNDSSG